MSPWEGGGEALIVANRELMRNRGTWYNLDSGAGAIFDHEILPMTTGTEAMAGDPPTVLDGIREQLAPYNKNGIELTEATDINADLNIDSVAILDLLMTIEDAYDISIPINLLADVRTVGDLADTVDKMIGARGESGSC